MGRLIYLLNVSLDGFVETTDKSLDWTMVDDELHSWFNDYERSIDATIYGRGLWDLMSAHWPTVEFDPSATDTELEFARLWLTRPKIVISSTLESVGWSGRLVRGDIEDVLRDVRAEFAGDIGVGGATIAASFIRRGLVDEYGMVVHPVALGAGTPYFPALDDPLRLRLTERREFSSGVEYRAYVPAG